VRSEVVPRGLDSGAECAFLAARRLIVSLRLHLRLREEATGGHILA